MKKILIIPFLLLQCNLVSAQAFPTVRCGIYFDYDAAGNRIKRYYDCKSLIDEPAQPNPDPGGVALGRPAGPAGVDNSVMKDDNKVKVFPNPVTDKFSIALSKPDTHTHFHIYDAKGAIITSGHIDTMQYDGSMGSLPPGNYVISVYFEHKTYNFTITKL